LSVTSIPLESRRQAMPDDRALDGWLVIDKPTRLSSNRVVERVRRLTGTKVGHAGTLDPLATGVLPLALGEATKTVAYAMSGLKRYRFRVRWGVARVTDDCEGAIVGESASRPSAEEIDAILPRFTGTILQSPPVYSAIKVDGRRAYALARAATPPTLPRRPVHITTLRLIAAPDRDHADCEALVGKGTYIRALARDLAVALGTFGHVVQLRRLSVGPFRESQAISLDSVAERRHSLAACGYLLPLEIALDDVPQLVLTAADAARLRLGQRVMPQDIGDRSHLERLGEGTVVAAWHEQAVVALARIENGGLRPARVINR
jgi:tRNA pseudouridine55 synthase